MTKSRAPVDPLAKVTPAYVNMFHRLQLVIARVAVAIDWVPNTNLDQHDVEELEYVYRTALEIEGQMRRYQKEANTKGG